MDFSDIPDAEHWLKIEFIDKGWSADQKYYIETDDDRKLVIRLADISQYQKKKAEYQAMEIIRKLGIDMSEPIDFGTCADGKMVYILLSWLEGELAEEALPGMDTQKQQNLGITAGKILKRIHSVRAPDGLPDWETRMINKINTKISQYRNCGYMVPNESRLIRFINDNIKYLRNRPQTLQHGDYHPGNFIMTPDERLGIIDFNRTDFGDPWEEFVRLTTFTKAISIPFAIGQINGYFKNRVPEKFFRLTALYSAIDAHFGITWAIPFGRDDIERSLARSQSIFEDYNGFETCVPAWYI